jgi:NifU-like protein involved in Fe-S cluster formation
MMTLSSTILDHASAPNNRRAMKDPSAVGRANLGGRPPEVTIFLSVKDGIIKDASFEAHGCGYTIACCSVLMELIANKSVESCWKLGSGDVCAELGELPRERQFCATLALEALQAALENLGSQNPSGRGDQP